VVRGQCAVTKSGTVVNGELGDARVSLRRVRRVIDFHETGCATSARLGPRFAPNSVSVDSALPVNSTIGDGSGNDASIVLRAVIAVVNFDETCIAGLANCGAAGARCFLGVVSAATVLCTERDGCHRDSHLRKTSVALRAEIETPFAGTAFLAPSHATCLLSVQRAVPKDLTVVNRDLLDAAVTAGSLVAHNSLEAFNALSACARIFYDSVVGHSAARRLAWAVVDHRTHHTLVGAGFETLMLAFSCACRCVRGAFHARTAYPAMGPLGANVAAVLAQAGVALNLADRGGTVSSRRHTLLIVFRRFIVRVNDGVGRDAIGVVRLGPGVDGIDIISHGDAEYSGENQKLHCCLM